MTGQSVAVETLLEGEKVSEEAVGESEDQKG